MSCGKYRRCSLDPALLWLWHRLSAVAPIRPLAWESPYAVGTALKRKKKKRMKVLFLIQYSEEGTHNSAVENIKEILRSAASKFHLLKS